MIQSDGVLSAAAALAADFHHCEVVMISEREKSHFQPGIFKACTNWKSQNTVVKLLGAFTVSNPQHDVTKRQYFHSRRLPLTAESVAPWSSQNTIRLPPVPPSRTSRVSISLWCHAWL